jgi:hypothetical protein
MSDKAGSGNEYHENQSPYRGYCIGLARDAYAAGQLPPDKLSYEEMRALQERDPRYR